MNGIICCSAQSGILIFAKSYQSNFGCGNLGNDAMQFASTLFALYQMSSDRSIYSSDCISYYKQVAVYVFH